MGTARDEVDETHLLFGAENGTLVQAGNELYEVFGRGCRSGHSGGRFDTFI
jgi:hypothetical protein